jgi:DNA-binding NarL/FixJ family response regulator
MTPIRLLIADDHRMLIDGIKALLRDAEDITVVAEAGNGAEVMTLLETTPVDLVLMDINMPVMNGIEATTHIGRLYPHIRVIALTMHSERTFISRVLKAGAAGYVLKNTGKPELLHAIRRVAVGETYFSSEVASVMMEQFMPNVLSRSRNAPRELVHELTKREVEILKLIAQEMTNNEIAERLFISMYTVETHRKNLIRKTGVKNTVGLVKYAMQQGLTE